jgi:hypothetical protein
MVEAALLQVCMVLGIGTASYFTCRWLTQRRVLVADGSLVVSMSPSCLPDARACHYRVGLPQTPVVDRFCLRPLRRWLLLVTLRAAGYGFFPSVVSSGLQGRRDSQLRCAACVDMSLRATELPM